MKSCFRQLIAGLALVVGTVASSHATIIDNTANDGGDITPFGQPDTATYGQTITIGADNHLNTFSLFLRDVVSGGQPLDLRGYVGLWDGTKATSILFESDTRTMNAAGTLQEFAFAPNLDLVSGQTYVLFLSISNLPMQDDSLFGMPYDGAVDSIPDGQFVFFNNGLDFSRLTSEAWDGASFFSADLDAWLRAELTAGAAVPEPGSLALLGLALAGIGFRRRRTS